MKMKFFWRLQTALLPLFAAAILGSCISDRTKEHVPVKDNSTITLTISVPANSKPATRALTESDEYSVNDVAVLAFDPGTKTFKGRYQGRIMAGPTGTGGASASMQFEVSLPIGVHDLMVVANSTAILNANSAALTLGTSQATIEKALKATMTTSGWATDNSGSSHRMPMWGYKTGVDVPDGFPISTINLVRMVAKVDVQLVSSLVDEDDVADSKFQLRSVRVYNYVEQGRLIPDTGGEFNWTTVDYGSLAGNKLPALPDGYTKADNTSGSEEYIERSVTLAADNRYQFLRGEIYLFESPKGIAPASGSGDFVDNTCLVIGGSFNNGPVTYYRIDFATRSVVDGVVTYTYMPILRNNSYTVTITDVTGIGHESEEDALRSAPTNITANILNWSNNDISTIVTDGVYMLGVSKNSYLLPRDPRGPYESDNQLTIVTNHSDGWSATVWDDEAGTVPLADDGTTGQPWLRLSQPSGTGNYDSGDEIYFNIDENKDATDRTAWIHIKAGTLSYKIKVVQKYMFIMVTDVITGEEITDIAFSSKQSTIGLAPVPRQVKVTWSPTTEDVYVTKGQGNPDLAWQTAYQTILTGGEHIITIDPNGVSQSEVNSDPFIVKSAELNFTLGLTSVTAHLAIEQTHYSLNPTNFNYITPTLLYGTGRVKSNAPWSCTWTSDMISGGMTSPTAQPITHSGLKTGVGFPYTFASSSEGRVTLTFVPMDINRQFDPVVVTIDAAPIPTVPRFTGFGTMINATKSYVGAFWRADQRGERLIRIPMASTNAGSWSVQVYDYGDDFSPGDILFSTAPTADPGVVWNYTANTWGTTGNAELLTDPDDAGYYVDDGREYTFGKTTTSDLYIEFRVGLKTKWSDQPDYDPVTKPARYAVIVISYGSNYGLHQKFFIRQGHEPDYVIAPGDPDTSGVPFDNNREDAIKWSAYNLTATGMNNDVGYVQIYRRPAYDGEDVSATGTGYPEFTDYPTKAGAYFQWANTSTDITFHRRAYNPGKWPVDFEQYQYSYWVWNENLFETCPEGYRRPDIKQSPSEGYEGNEAWQSFAATQSDPVATDNSGFGLYADGYFDRTTPDSSQNAVSYKTKDVAYAGRLVFNPVESSDAHRNASLFFPAAGRLSNNSSWLPAKSIDGQGTAAFYASRYSSTSTHFGRMNINTTAFSTALTGDRQNGYTIRCVVEETD